MKALTNYVESNFLLHLIAGDEEAARNAVADMSISELRVLRRQLNDAALLARVLVHEREDSGAKED